MHTFKPGMEVERPTKKTARSEYNIDHPLLIDWLKTNTKFVIGEERRWGGQDKIAVVGVETDEAFLFSPSDLTPKSEVFKVRVVKCERSGSWYADAIGNDFDATTSQHEQYWYIPSLQKNIIKSDCVVVTDQKFKVGDPVKIEGKDSGVVVRYKEETQKYLVSIGENGFWCKEENLELDQPTSLPFTEELFNQGKYEVLTKDGIRVSEAHIHNGRVWGKQTGGFDVWSFEDLTLKEKEVVRYGFLYDLTDWGFPSKEAAMRNVNDAQMLVKLNLTTRTVEKVWDYLTDKK